MIDGAASARVGAKASTGAGLRGTSLIIGGMRSAEKRELNAVWVLRARAGVSLATDLAAREG